MLGEFNSACANRILGSDVEEEYAELQRLAAAHAAAATYSAAGAERNAAKNRYRDILPCENNKL